MASEHLQSPPATARTDTSLTPITELHDPRAIQILSTEHWSVLTARSLAYNEAFVRAGMFLTFLSMSFVGLALLADAMGFSSEFLTLTAIVLGFDLIVGLTTFERISGANGDDLRALHGMARIRHGYIQAAPLLLPYFSTATTDDVDSVVRDYDAPDGPMTIVYALSTSLGMIALIVAMLGGVEVGVIGMLVGLDMTGAILLGILGAVVIFALLLLGTFLRVTRNQERLETRFPAPAAPAATPTQEKAAG